MWTFRSLSSHFIVFPECVARVPVSLWGSGGWGCVRSTSRNRSQPSATVHARPVWPCLWQVLQQWSLLQVSSIALLRFAWQAWHFVTFKRVLQRVEKSFCVAGAILLRRLQKMRCSFRGRRSTLVTSITISRGRRSTLDVSCGLFFANRIVRATSSADNVQIPWQAWHFVICAYMCWKLTEASHETSILRLQILMFIKKTRRKTSILELQSLKMGGSLARNALFDAPTCLVSSLRFSSGLTVSMRKLQHRSFSKVSKQVVMPFAWQAWHLVIFSRVCKSVESRFVWTAQLYTPHISTHYTPHSTLYTPHSTHDTPHLTLDTLHSTLSTPHFTLYTPHFTLYTLHFTLHTSHSTLHTLHSTLYTPHSTLHTPHSTLHTLHFTLYTPHFTLHTPHFALHIPHSTLYTLHCKLHTLHSTLHVSHSTLHTPHSTLYTPHSTLYTEHSTLYTPHFTLHTPHSTLHTPHSTLHTLHFTLYTPHFTLHTPHFTLHTSHSTLHTLDFTLHTLDFTLNTSHFTLHTPHFAFQPLPHSTVYSALVR